MSSKAISAKDFQQKEYNPDCKWFKVDGDSMTNDGPDSIPDKSMILGRRISVNARTIPKDMPLAIVFKFGNIEHRYIKCIDSSSTVSTLVCRSLNEKYEPFYILIEDVVEIFKILKVVGPESIVSQ